MKIRVVLLAIFIILFTACVGSNKKSSEKSQKEIVWEGEIHKLMLKNEFSKAEKEAKKMFKKYPQNAEVLNILGVINIESGNSDKAEYYYKKALELEPEKAVYHSNIARVYLEKGSYKAIEEMKIALKFEPDSVKYMLILGYCYSLFDDFDKAIQVTGKALKKDPQNVDALHSIGAYYAMKKNNEEKAIKFYKLALEQDPNNIGVIGDLSVAYWSSGKYEEALKYLEPLFLKKLATKNMYKTAGHCYYLKKEFEKSKENFEIALKNTKLENLQTTKYFYVFDFLAFGLVSLQLDMLEESERLFKEICKLHPEEYGYLYGLGKIHFKRQQYHKAEAYLEKYLEKYTEKEYSSYSKYIDINEVEDILEEIEKMKEEVEENEAA